MRLMELARLARVVHGRVYREFVQHGSEEGAAPIDETRFHVSSAQLHCGFTVASCGIAVLLIHLSTSGSDTLR